MNTSIFPSQREVDYFGIAKKAAQSTWVFPEGLLNGGFCNAASLKISKTGLAFTTEYFEKQASVDTVEGTKKAVINIKDYTAGTIVPAGSWEMRQDIDIRASHVRNIGLALRRRLDASVVEALMRVTDPGFGAGKIPQENYVGDGTTDLTTDLVAKALSIGEQKNIFTGDRMILVANSVIAGKLRLDMKATSGDFVDTRPLPRGYIGTIWGFEVYSVPNLQVKDGLATSVVKFPTGAPYFGAGKTGVYAFSVGDNGLECPVGWAYNELTSFNAQIDPSRAGGWAINAHTACGAEVISPEEVMVINVKEFS